jgi:hypothetical protein
MLKLEILTSLCERENVPTILKELQLYIKDASTLFVCAVIRAVAKVADADPSVSDSCMTGLMHMLLCTQNESVIAECVVSLRQLLQQNTQSAMSAKILKQLMKLLIMENGIDVSSARSNIIWLVGEFHESVPKLSGDILRILATEYINETTETKMQIMNLAIKLALHVPENENIQNLMTYVLEMSRYDTNTDLRDRARFMTAVMGLAPAEDGHTDPADLARHEQALATLAEQAKSIMLAPKLPPVTLLASTDMDGIPTFSVGSLSAVVGHFVSGFEGIPTWPVEQPDPSVRDAVRYEQASTPTTSSAGAQGHRRGAVGGGDSSDSDSGDEAAFRQFKSKVGTDDASRSSSDASDDSDASRSSRSSRSGSDSSSSSGRSRSSDSDSDSSRSSGGSSRSSGSRSSDSSSSASDDRRRGRRPAPKPTRSSSSSDSSSSASADSDSDSDDSQRRRRNGKGAKGKARPTAALSSSLVPPLHATAPAPAAKTVARQPVRKVHATAAAAASAATKSGGHVEDLTLFAAPAAPAAPLVGAHSASDGALGDLLPSTGSSKDSLMDLLSAPSPVASTAQQISSLFVDAAADGLLGLSLDAAAPAASTTTTTTATATSARGDDVLVATVDSSDDSDGLDAKNFLLRPAVKPAAAAAAAAATVDTSSSSSSPMAAAATLQLTPPAADAASGVAETLSEEKVVLRPELGGGLAVTIAYRRSVSATAIAGAQCVFLVLRNTKETPLRRVRVNFPSDVRRTNTPEIPLLSGGQEFRMPVEVVLLGLAAKQIKMDIRSDQGAYTGLFVVQEWDWMQPLVMDAAEFEAARSRLKGFSEVSKAYTAEQLQLQAVDADQLENEIIRRVLRDVHAYLVQGAGVQEIMLAGSLRKSVASTVGEKVLMTVTTTASTG